MATAVISGQDTIKINNRIITDLAGDTSALTFASNLASVKIGKNGNSVFAFNDQGRQCDMVLSLVRGSPDDQFLNTLLAIMKKDFAAFYLLAAEVIKRTTEKPLDGRSTQRLITREDIYILAGGVFTKEVEAKEGDTAATWRLSFASVSRVIV